MILREREPEWTVVYPVGKFVFASTENPASIYDFIGAGIIELTVVDLGQVPALSAIHPSLSLSLFLRSNPQATVFAKEGLTAVLLESRSTSSRTFFTSLRLAGHRTTVQDDVRGVRARFDLFGRTWSRGEEEEEDEVEGEEEEVAAAAADRGGSTGGRVFWGQRPLPPPEEGEKGEGVRGPTRY